MGEKITLQIDHINGINSDNRLENLRFLCPNCHTQTETYGSKNPERNKKEKEKIERKMIENSKTINLIKERRDLLLSVDLTKYGWVQKVSILWNVSHTQVKRWIKKYYKDLF